MQIDQREVTGEPLHLGVYFLSDLHLLPSAVDIAALNDAAIARPFRMPNSMRSPAGSATVAGSTN
jgi:hypothetical protein